MAKGNGKQWGGGGKKSSTKAGQDTTYREGINPDANASGPRQDSYSSGPPSGGKRGGMGKGY